MNFNYQQIYEGKTYIKNGVSVAYKLDKYKISEYNHTLTWLSAGNADYRDAGNVFRRLKENPSWSKSSAKKLSSLSTLIKLLGAEDLAKMNITEAQKENVLNAYVQLAKAETLKTDCVVNRYNKRKSPSEEGMWNKEEYEMFVQKKVDRAAELYQLGLENMTDIQKNEFQGCVLVLWYSVFRNIRALQGTIRKKNIDTDYNNYIQIGDDVATHKSPIVIIYNIHKANRVTGITDKIIHILEEEQNPVLFNFIKILSTMCDESSYLFNDFVNRRRFENIPFCKFLMTAHNGEVGARLLRVMQKTEFWETCPSLAEVEKELYETGQKRISESISYSRRD